MSAPVLDSHATPESIEAAKEAAQAEREEVYRTCGIWVDEQGQIRQEPKPLKIADIEKRSLSALKRCDRFKDHVWVADLPYCPYCNISPDDRLAWLQQETRRQRTKETA